MRYVRAEQESDWPKHVSGIWYPCSLPPATIGLARYALYYMKSINDLPNDLCEAFTKGQHTMPHKIGLFNGIWSDMVIESIIMT